MTRVEDIVQHLPDECPYCRQYHGIGWSEFRIGKTTFVFVDNKSIKPSFDADIFKVICTKCGEQIPTTEAI